MSWSLPLYASITLVALFIWVRRLRRGVLADLRGPPAKSFLLGNLEELMHDQVGLADFKWQQEYGNAVRIKSTLGGDLLWLSDSKAMQYIYQPSGYNYGKWEERRALSRLHSGRGLVYADGVVHKRQRKVMLPSFGGPESRALFPVFNRTAEAVTLKWKDILSSHPDDTAVIDIPFWLGRAAMDAIGEAAFDYKFGALEDKDNELIRGYNNLMNIIFGSPTKERIFVMDVARFLPLRVIEWLEDHMSGPVLQKSRDCERVATQIARELIDTKGKALLEGQGSRDIFSLLVKANASENERNRLDEEEMISEMRTLLFAGHDTTSNTLSFALLELARNPSIQTRLRNEIHEMERIVHARGDSSFLVSDLDAMPYTQAVIKETLRCHPVVSHNFRCPIKDDVLPLSKPIVTKSGKVLTELPIQKGTRIVLSIVAYNRDPDIWGANPHTFDPERWLDGRTKRTQSVGVYSNLFTFAGGVRGCIGWRFALHEMQAFILELVSNFSFAPTEDTKRLRREQCGIMQPTLEGEVEKGTQMPLQVTIALRDD